MKNWFRPQRESVEEADLVDARTEARPVERHTVVVDSKAPEHAHRAELDLAYERGRARERQSRRGSPMLALVGLLLVVTAGALIYLAVKTGSFSSGGAVVDQGLDKAAHAVNAPIKNAAESTGAALQNAGRSLK